MEILILSDNHGYMDDNLLKHASEVDEVWHAGDWLTVESADALDKVAKVRGVYGNVDSAVLKSMYPEELRFTVEQVKVGMRHIAGYPGRYNAQAKALIRAYKPDLMICGHSHILKIVRDPLEQHLHINPGACGIKGFHVKRTFVRLTIEKDRIFNLRVIEHEK